MKKITALTSLILLGTTLSYLFTSYLKAEDINLDLRDEEIHLYL